VRLRRVVWRLVVDGAVPLVVTGEAFEPQMAEAPAAPGGFPGWLTDARAPGDVDPAGPEFVAARAPIGLVLEQRDAHSSGCARGAHGSVLLAVELSTVLAAD
jgi:hypothetical protein